MCGKAYKPTFLTLRRSGNWTIMITGILALKLVNLTRECLLLCLGGSMCVCACVSTCVRACVHACVRHSVRLEQLLRCAHNGIVNIMNVYIERNNMQVKLLRFRKNNIAFIHVYFCEARNLTRPTCLRLESR